MSDYIDKIRKGAEELPIHDPRVEEAFTPAEKEKLAGLANASFAGTSLVIPEQPAPEPVITIDGVAYYHKKEFDITYLIEQSVAEYDILTGEIYVTSSESKALLSFGIRADGSKLAVLFVFTTRSPYEFHLLSDYTSRSFTVVDTPEEVTDDTKICLPTCSAYYGFLSEDGKTFISYYNLKTDGAPTYVDSVKQGNASIPLHGKDVRLPDATAADVGKILAVNDQGDLVLQQAPAGGTKLYLHSYTSFNGQIVINIISTKGTALTAADYDKIVSGSINDADNHIYGPVYSISGNPYVVVLYYYAYDADNSRLKSDSYTITGFEFTITEM